MNMTGQRKVLVVDGAINRRLKLMQVLVDFLTVGVSSLDAAKRMVTRAEYDTIFLNASDPAKAVEEARELREATCHATKIIAVCADEESCKEVMRCGITAVHLDRCDTECLQHLAKTGEIPRS